jgi:hypothetical protein
LNGKFGLFYCHFGIIKAIGVFYDHLVYLVAIQYLFSYFGIFNQEISGKPANQSG